jgi:flagellar basal body-associated protein FliL
MTQDGSYYGEYQETTASKKPKTWVIILIIVAVLLLCCCAVLVAGWFFGDPLLEWLSDQGVDVGLMLFRIG